MPLAAGLAEAQSRSSAEDLDLRVGDLDVAESACRPPFFPFHVYIYICKHIYIYIYIYCDVYVYYVFDSRFGQFEYARPMKDSKPF